MAHQFLTKTQIALENCVRLGDSPILEQHESLHRLLRARVGAQAASLFAEPLLSRGNDAAPASVAWYGEFEGNTRPLSALPVSARGAMETYLSDTLAPLRPLLDDPQTGPILGAALWQLDANDVLVVGGRPVLINWGMRPSRLGGDPSALAGHYAATLGRYLPLATPPGLPPSLGVTSGAAPIAATFANPAAAAAGMSDAGAFQVASGTGAAAQAATANYRAAVPADFVSGQGTGTFLGATPPAAAPPLRTGDNGQNGRLPLVAWLPLVVLLGLAILVLLWLLLPGTRLFPRDQSPPAISENSAAALAESVNRDLQTRLDTLRQALAGSVCRADGTLIVPSGRTLDGLLPPPVLLPGQNPAPGDASGDQSQAAPDGLLPPNPQRVIVPGSAAAQQAGGIQGELASASLLQLIEKQTVLVMVASGNSLSTGTGFVVGQGLILTNHHVVETAANGQGQILVINANLHGPQPAQVLKSSGPLEQVGDDFALLQIADQSLPAVTLHLPAATLKLTNVIAAGFPGDVLATDTQFQAIQRGDFSNVPDLTVTDGTITTEQALSPNTNVLVHSAPLSNGNSGGPLIDLCGRVVGVNTFVRRGNLRTLNFALATSDLLEFLADTAATPNVQSDACSPQVMRPAPTPAADMAEAPTDAPAPPTRDANPTPEVAPEPEAAPVVEAPAQLPTFE